MRCVRPNYLTPTITAGPQSQATLRRELRHQPLKLRHILLAFSCNCLAQEYSSLPARGRMRLGASEATNFRQRRTFSQLSPGQRPDRCFASDCARYSNPTPRRSEISLLTTLKSFSRLGLALRARRRSASSKFSMASPLRHKRGRHPAPPQSGSHADAP